MPLAPPEPPAVGYFKVRRGLPEADAPPGDVMWDYREVMRRAGQAGYCVLQFIIDGASLPKSGGYGAVRLARDARDLGVTPRQLRVIVDELLEKRLVERHTENPWLFRPCFENFEDAPVRPLVKKPRKPVAREVHQNAPDQEMHFTPGEPSGDSPSGPSSEIDFTPNEIDCPSPEMDCRKPETYCPWNWPCPHLSNRLVEIKKVAPIEEQAKPEEPALASGEAATINFWMARQPWGRINSLTRRGLTDAQMAPVLAELRACGRTAAELIEYHVHLGTVISNPDNIVGLLIRFIRALPPRAYSAPNRAPDRLTPARDIGLKIPESPKKPPGG